MARASAIDRLPPDILEQFQELLRDPRVTQLQATAEINEILEREGHPERVSKSSVNRYSMRMEKVGQRLRESREMASMWIGKLGAQPQGEMGHLINEMIRSITFDVSLMLKEGKLTAESLPGVIDNLKNLALTAARVEKASSENVKRDSAIRKEERERAAEEAASAAEQSLASQGMSRESIDAIKREILGIL